MLSRVEHENCFITSGPSICAVVTSLTHCPLKIVPTYFRLLIFFKINVFNTLFQEYDQGV